MWMLWNWMWLNGWGKKKAKNPAVEMMLMTMWMIVVTLIAMMTMTHPPSSSANAWADRRAQATHRQDEQDRPSAARAESSGGCTNQGEVHSHRQAVRPAESRRQAAGGSSWRGHLQIHSGADTSANLSTVFLSYIHFTFEFIVGQLFEWSLLIMYVHSFIFFHHVSFMNVLSVFCEFVLD